MNGCRELVNGHYLEFSGHTVTQLLGGRASCFCCLTMTEREREEKMIEEDLSQITFGMRKSLCIASSLRNVHKMFNEGKALIFLGTF